MNDGTLRGAIQRYAESHPEVDPRELVEPILRRLGPELRNEAARRGILRTLTEEIRFDRTAAAPIPGPSWRRAAAHAQTECQYCVDGVWKALGDCSRQDIAWLIAYYHESARRLTAAAGEMETIKQELIAEHVGYVRDLRRFRRAVAA